MRKLLPLCLVLLACAVSANAQDLSGDNAALNDGGAQDSAAVSVTAPQVYTGPQVRSAGNSDFPDWELGVGFQFHDIRPPEANLFKFHTSGINFSITRFFGDWLGVEAQAGFGFGHTGQSTNPPNRVAKDTLLVGGPRFAYRSNSRWEPWGHVLVGLDHFRFTQGAGGFGSNNGFGFLAGAGVDYHINEHFSVRGEGDYLGTHIFSGWERSLQVVAGAVLNF